MQQQETKISKQAFQLHQQLAAQIRQRIEDNNGMIDFAEYMQMALYAPGLGYYQNGLQKFGESGDFITAPEMGSLFAIGLANGLMSIDKDFTGNLLEIGAGSGKLAADLLQVLDKSGRTPVQYYILEPSANLQSLQYQTIARLAPKLLDKVTWLANLPENFEGVVIANEVVDAIPCRRVRKTPKGWQSVEVSVDDGKFIWQLADTVKSENLPQVLLQGDYIDGYTCEIRPLTKGWLSGIANALSKGIVILFDYGYPQREYYHPQRIDGSLCCFTRHQAHDEALELAGLQDITAHVEFTQVANDAVEAGMTVVGFTTQAGFLLENGILEQQVAENLAANYQLSQQIQKLTAPGQMGEVIKVICLDKQTGCVPQGFSLQDQLHRL